MAGISTPFLKIYFKLIRSKQPIIDQQCACINIYVYQFRSFFKHTLLLSAELTSRLLVFVLVFQC